MNLTKIYSMLHRIFLICILLFTSSFTISSQTIGADKEAKFIKAISSEVSFIGDKLLINNRLTLNKANQQDDEAVYFYLPSTRLMDSLEVKSNQGEKMKFTVKDCGTSSLIELRVAGGSDFLEVKYALDLNKMNAAISYHRDDNECFILPEESIFPKNNRELAPDNISYTLKVTDANKKYSYLKEIPNSQFLLMPPCVIAGNFTVMQYGRVKAYIPVNLEVDYDQLKTITSTLADSYDYYSTIFGKSHLPEDLNLFFLHRRGGYAHSDGIILDENMILKTQVPFNDYDLTHVIAHEVAHLWWGWGVMSSAWALNEGLAEYSTDLYLSDKCHYTQRKIYALKNFSLIFSNITPVNIEEPSLFNNAKNYKLIAYKKLPILFHEAELKVGRGNIIKALKQFYLVQKEKHPVYSMADFLAAFPDTYQDELRQDIDGTLKSWPDFYVKKATDKSVVFQGDHVVYEEVVPVELLTKEKKVVLDTLHFSAKNKEITRTYQDSIIQIIIDKDFSTNQALLLNDCWSNDAIYRSDNKWPESNEPKYHDFSNKLLSYLFTEEAISIDSFAEKQNSSFLVKAKNILDKMHLWGYYLIVHEKEKRFEISIAYTSNNNFHKGYISGFFSEDNNFVRLKSLGRTNI